MSRYIIIRETGADSHLLIDKKTGRVEPVECNPLETFASESTEQESHSMFKGVDMAISLKSRGEVSSRMFYNGDRSVA